MKKGVCSGMVFGLTQGLMFISMGLMFYIGVHFLVDYKLDVEDFLTTIYAVIICGIVSGSNGQHLSEAS